MTFHIKPHQGIQTLTPYQPGKSIEAVQKETGLSDIIKLASNENPLGCSPMALQALRELPASVYATYPSSLNHPLVTALAEKLAIEETQLFFSNGSDFIFGLLMICFALHQNKHILTHDAAFSTYIIQAQTLNIPFRSVPINSDWSVNTRHLIEACNEHTALLFIANPNNPTGGLIRHEEIEYLLQHIPEQTLLVLDEAYYEYARSQQSKESLSLLADYPNLIITRTFSKIYGLAGLRLGYAIAHPEIVRILQRVQLPFTVNQATMQAALAAIEDSSFIKQTLNLTEEGMRQMQKGFHQLGYQYLPSAGNFLTFNCQEDGLTLFHYLLKRGIIIRPLHPYAMPEYLRVTIGTSEQNERFLQALAAFKNR